MITSKNSAKIVNIYKDINDNLKLYTELNTDISTNDLVFIIGGNLDNTNLDISNIYSNGYEVLLTDNNVITINKKYESNINIIDSYISTTPMISGEFNGGEFNGGVLGVYSSKSILFNNKSNNAKLNNGLFLGGTFLHGTAKYSSSNKNGSRYINKESNEYFVDDNKDKGYTQFVTGDISLIYSTDNDILENGSDYNNVNIINNIVMFDKFLPKVLVDNISDMRIVFLNSAKNVKIYDISSINIINKSITIVPNIYNETYIDTNNLSVENNFTDIIFDELISDARLEIYSKDVVIEKATIHTTKIYGGNLQNTDVTGSKIYDGNITESILSSKTDISTVYNGYISKSNTSNINFNGGILKDSVWSGDNLYQVTATQKRGVFLAFKIEDKYVDLIDTLKSVFISYVKNGNQYLPMYDENPVKEKLLNYREVKVTYDGEYFITDFEYPKFDINHQNMKVSQTNFNNGIMIGNTITSGLLRGNNMEVFSPEIIGFLIGQDIVQYLQVAYLNSSNFKPNDLVEFENLTLVYELNDLTTYENMVGTSRVLFTDDINKTIILELPKNIKDINDYQEEKRLISVISNPDRKIYITKNLFLNGTINSGYIDDKIFRAVALKNNNDKTLVSNNSYYKKVDADNMVFTSDILYSSVLNNNSYVTNNIGDGKSTGDTILDSVMNTSDINRGYIRNLTMMRGSILNAYIDKSLWYGGVYKNGYGLYSNSNRSGIKDIKGYYSQMSAPSVIYINGDTIQLEEPSTYQKNYKVIFKDFDIFGNNTISNNVFTIRDRNDISDKLFIDDINETYLCINDISHYEIYDNTYYLVDKTHNRVFITGNAEVKYFNFDNIINDIYFDNIGKTLYVASANNVYTIINGVLSVFQTYSDTVKAIIYLNSSIVVLTDKNNILYNGFEVNITNNIIEKTCFVNNPNNSNLYLYYTNSTKLYRVLLTVTNSVSFQNETLVFTAPSIIASISGRLDVNNTVDVFTIYNNECHKIMDDFSSINSIKLDFGSNVYISKPYEKLYSIVDYNKNKQNCLLISSEFDNQTVGFKNTFNKIKVEDISNPNNFFYYDDLSNRIIYTDINGNYNNDLVVDISGFKVKEMVYANNSIVYALLTKTNSDYYVARISVNNDQLSYSIGNIQVGNADTISKLKFTDTLYFVYNDISVCQYNFTTDTTDISTLFKLTNSENYEIVDFQYSINNDIYAILKSGSSYYLTKSSELIFNSDVLGVSSTILVDNSSIMKSFIISNGYIYIVSDNGVIRIGDYIYSDYEKNKLMPYLPGNFDKIISFDDVYFTLYIGYNIKRVKYVEQSLNTDVKSFVVINDNDKIVLSENRLLLNNTHLAGEYKNVRKSPNVILFPNISTQKQEIIDSSMNPMNPMGEVRKILYSKISDNSDKIYFAENKYFFRLSYINGITSPEFNSATELDSNCRYIESGANSYKTFFYKDVINNRIVVKELIFIIDNLDSKILDISFINTDDISYKNNIILLTDLHVYIHNLNTTDSNHMISTSNVSNKKHIVGDISGKFYLMGNDGIMYFYAITTINPTNIVITSTPSNNRLIVLESGETIKNILLLSETSLKLGVETNNRTFYSIWSSVSGNATYSIQYPFITNNILLESPIISHTMDLSSVSGRDNITYLYENDSYYKVDINTGTKVDYDVKYLEKYNNSYTFLYINDTVLDLNIVTRQKRLGATNTINISNNIEIASNINIVKLVAVNDNICYALSDDGNLYKLNFVAGSIETIILTSSDLVYRITSPTISVVTEIKITDISLFGSRIIMNVEFEIGTSYYNDIFVLENNNVLTKEDINFVYKYSNVQDVNGFYDTSLLYPMDINGDVVTPTTDLIYVYESSIPNSSKFAYKKYDISDVITYSFYVSNASSNYVKRQNNLNFEYMFNDNTNYYFKSYIPTFDNVDAPATTNLYVIGSDNKATIIVADLITSIPNLPPIINSDEIYISITTGEYDLLNNNIVKMDLNYIKDISAIIPPNANNNNKFFVLNSIGNPYLNLNLTANSIGVLQTENTYFTDSVITVDNNLSNDIVLKGNNDNTDKEIYLKPYNLSAVVSLHTLSYDVFDILNLTTIFPKYSNIYIETEVLKLYKTIYNITSPFISARIINDSIINNGSDMNNGGDAKTLYFMNSIWNNGLFTGSWNEPNMIDNQPISKTSFFIDGQFKGDFHKGFFLGGDISGNIFNGHFIANTNNIKVNANISSYRYDITSMVRIGNKMKLDIDTIDKDFNLIETTLPSGIIVTIPNVFESKRLFVNNIIDLPLNIAGNKTVMVEISSSTDISNMFNIGSNVLMFSKIRISELNNYFKLVDKKYSNNKLSLIIETNINVTDLKINSDDIYVSLNEYFVLEKMNNEYYIDVDANQLKEYIDVVGNNVKLHNNNYKQLFTTSFSSSFYDVEIISDDISNVYLNNVKYVGKTISNSVIEKSTINADTIFHSIIYSGNINADMRMCHIMCVDEKGYLVDNNYQTNIEGEFFGEFIDISNYAVYKDKIIISPNGILNDTAKYRFIAIRGFSGEESTRIGANYSVVHRIEDIDMNNNIYINNYLDVIPTADLVTQKVDIRDLSGQNIRGKSADAIQLYDYTFKTDISYKETGSGWFIDLNDNTNTAQIILDEDGYKITGNNNDIVSIIQKTSNDKMEYWKNIAISNISSNVDISFDLIDNTFNSCLNGTWDGTLNNINFKAVYDIQYIKVILTLPASINGIIEKLFITPKDSIPFIETKEFKYAYMSNSSASLVNNTFKGKFHSVWNSGKFDGVDSIFDGKWFGSTPYTTLSGKFKVVDMKITHQVKEVFFQTQEVELSSTSLPGKLYVKIADTINNGNLEKYYEPVYTTIINNTIDISSIINITDGVYDMTIYQIEDKNITFTFESNTISTTPLMLKVNESKAGMLINNYLKDLNSCDITLKYNNSIVGDISPIISFVNNETQIGIRIFYSKSLNRLVYVDELQTIYTDFVIETSYFRLNINGDTIGYTKLADIDFNINYIGKSVFIQNNKYIYRNATNTIEKVTLSENSDIITQFDFLYQDKFISGKYIFEDDKTYAFNGLNKFDVASLKQMNPIIDFDLVNEKPSVDQEGVIILLTSTIDLSDNLNTLFNYYSIGLVSVDYDGVYYKIEVVESFQNGSSSIQYKEIIHTTDLLRYSDKINIVLSKDKLYINGDISGEFISLNRNIIQYTDETKIVLGKQSFITSKPGFSGYITDFNVWENKINDIYDIYLTDILPKTNIDISRNTPYYSNTDNFKKLINADKNIVDGVYSNLNGFKEWYKTTISTSVPFTAGKNVASISLSNMKNFQFFGRKYKTDENGNLDINVTKNGYIFFDLYADNTGVNTNTFYISETSLPVTSFVNDDKKRIFKSFNTMDAIVMNTLLSGSIGNYTVKYTDKKDYAIIVFMNGSLEICRLFIDKITSCISMYINKVIKDTNQKLFGLVRKDGTKVFVNDDIFKFEKYAGDNQDAVYNDLNALATDTIIKNPILVSFQPQIYKTALDEADVVSNLYDKNYIGLKESNKIEFYGDSYRYDAKKFITSEYSYMTSSPKKFFDYKKYIGELYKPTEFSINVPRMSYFYNGVYTSKEWYNGVLCGGVIYEPNFIWKYGLKLNGSIKSGVIDSNGKLVDSKLKGYSHWLGGYSEGDNDISELRNIVWYRGKHSGGKFTKGYVFSYDYLNDDNRAYTLFDKSVVYSNINQNPVRIYTNLYVEDKVIQLTPNTDYEISADVLDTAPGASLDSLFSYAPNINFTKLKTVDYNGMGGVYMTTVNNVTEQSYAAEKLIVSIKFNSGQSNYITFNSVDRPSNVDNIKMFGYKNTTPNLDINLLENFDTVWASGYIRSEKRELNYKSDYTKTYQLSDRTITLPLVDNTVLGCLWLSGIFDGGIIANTFWNSLDISQQGTTKYEKLIGHLYESMRDILPTTKGSFFLSGKMINSAWYGGKVLNNSAQQNVVFGDILTNFQTHRINEDFKQPNNFVGFVKSTLNTAYKTVLGKKIFTGYHLSDNKYTNKQIEYNRITSQNNIDGIASVYIHRGVFEKCIIQHSIIQSYDLNDKESYDMSYIEDVNVNNKTYGDVVIIADSYTFMSQLNGVVFNTTISYGDKLHIENPQALIYHSEFNYGIFQPSSGVPIQPDAPLKQNVYDIDTITDALISRSVWNSGVFFGGTVNNSIWKSGYNKSVIYKHLPLGTTPSIKELAWETTTGTSTHKPYVSLSSYNDSDIFSDNTIRYSGNVDNYASVFVNGRMNGCIWHGGVFMRGVFTDKTYINLSKSFDTVDEPINKVGFTQKAIFTRGIIMGGYFGRYINRSEDIATYILSYNANTMTDNNTMLGTNVVVSDDISVFLSRRNMRNSTHPYFGIINCLMSGGYVFNDTSETFNDTVLFNTYSRIGNYYTALPQPNKFVFENGMNNMVTLTLVDTKVWDNGNVIIKGAVRDVNGVDVSWRHNIVDLGVGSDLASKAYYGDNTSVTSINNAFNGNSNAQGDGTVILDTNGEPYYSNVTVTSPDVNFLTNSTNFTGGSTGFKN